MDVPDSSSKLGTTKQHHEAVVVVQEVAEVALPHLPHCPFTGSACSKVQGAIPHCNLGGLWSLFNLCPPPQPSYTHGPSKTGSTKFVQGGEKYQL